MRYRSHLVTLAGILLAWGLHAPAAGADGVVQKFPKYHAIVDWSRAVVVVHGYAPLAKGASPAAVRISRRAARRDALKNTVAVAMSIVPVSGENRRRLAMVAAVRRAVSRCRIAAESRLPGGRYMVTLRVPLTGNGSLSGVLLPYLRGKTPFAPAKAAVVASRGEPAPASEEELLTPEDARGPFTGLVVDARGFGVQNTMCPAIYNHQNVEIYSGQFADEEFVQDVGVVGYTTTIKGALANTRVGKSPLVIRATGSPDDLHRCVAVSEADAGRILDADKEGKFLKKCAVIFVIDPPAVGSM